MNKYKLLVFAFICIIKSIDAQVSIYGKVIDINGIPINGAKIYIDSTYDETNSLHDGSYELRTLEKGKRKIIVSNVGYFDEEKNVDIDTAAIKLDFQFKLKDINLNVVEIQSKKNRNIQDVNEINSLESITILTTVTDGNVVSAIKLLPGVQQVGESGLLYTRGGDGTETQLYMDGMLIKNYLRSSSPNQSATSRFSPSLFRNTQFCSSGYASQYGGAMSSSVLLESTDLPYRNNANISISPIFVAGDFTLLNKKGKAALTTSFSYTNLLGYTKLFKSSLPGQNFYAPPSTYEGYIKYTQKTPLRGILKLFCNYSSSSLAFSKVSIDDPNLSTRYTINNNNIFSVLKWNGKIKNWKVDYGLAWSDNNDKIQVDSSFFKGPIINGNILKQGGQLLQNKLVLKRELGRSFEISMGAESNQSLDNFKKDDVRLTIKENQTALFTETKFLPNEKFTAIIGLRTEYSSLIKRGNVSPRAQVLFTLAKTNLIIVNYGWYFQKPDISFFLDSVNDHLHFQKSTMYSVAYQKKIADRTLRGEIFYKDYNNLIKTIPSLNNSGNGFAQGFELYIKDPASINFLEYWVSYSYLNSKRNFIDYPYSVTPPFIAAHTFSAVLKTFLKKPSLIVSTTYTYSSGRHYFNPNRNVSEFMEDKTISYNNVNLNLIHVTKIHGAFAVIVFTVSNIVGFNQEFGYSYSTINPKINEPIKPLYKRFFFLGLFLNFGIDNRNQIIDDHL